MIQDTLNNLKISSHEISEVYDVRPEVAYIILSKGYTMCQTDILETKDLNTNKTVSE